LLLGCRVEAVGDLPPATVLIPTRPVDGREHIVGRERFRDAPRYACKVGGGALLILAQPVAPSIAMPDTFHGTGFLDHQCDRDAFLDIEDVFVFYPLRGWLPRLRASMQIDQIDLVEAAHQALAHTAKCRVVQP